MNAVQSKMARAALGWSTHDLANEAGLGRATVVRFEDGGNASEGTRSAIRAAFERARIRFVNDGPLAGAVYSGLRPTTSVRR